MSRHIPLAALLWPPALALAFMVADRPTVAQAPAPAPAPAAKLTRLSSNPLITVNSSPTLGGNVNGPSVIRVPDWIEQPLGTYYMYFANHRGTSSVWPTPTRSAGPWTIYEPGVLHVKDTAFFRPQPDLARLAGNNTHLASPEVFVDTANAAW